MMAAVCAGIFPAPCPSWASAGCNVDRLLAAAHSRDLHEARYWHILMHYEQKLSGIVTFNRAAVQNTCFLRQCGRKVTLQNLSDKQTGLVKIVRSYRLVRSTPNRP